MTGDETEEAGRCPDSSGELWKDVEQGRVMIGVGVQAPLGFQVEGGTKGRRVRLGHQWGQTKTH